MDKLELLESIKKMGFGSVQIAKHTGIPDSRIRSWYFGRGLPKHEDFQKLQELHKRFAKMPTNDHADGSNEEIQTLREEITRLNGIVGYLEGKMEELQTINGALIHELNALKKAVVK